MQLAIVMPVLNEGETISRRLRALAPLRARGARLWVVDGGSTDATWALARAQADVLLCAPRGRAAQMNAGAAAALADARVDVLLFLHADTELPADADRLIVDALAAGPDRPVWGRFDVRIDGAHCLLRVVERMMNWRSRTTGIATGDQAMFMTRAAWEAAGGFPDQPLMEDIAVSKSLKRQSAPACIAPAVITSARRWEKHGVVRTVLLMWRLRAAYFLGASAQKLAAQYGYSPAPTLHRAAVAVLAKAPVAGLAKTRLIPALGAAGAARAQRRFTLAALHCARMAQHAASGNGYGYGQVSLWCAPSHEHRFFKALQASASRADACLAQAEGDLGARMGHAFQTHFAEHPDIPLLLIGTDCPVLSPGHLQQAAQSLQTHDVVLIPAEDGGYVLIGMRRWVPQALQTISWSTDQVLLQTREQLRRCGASWQELATLWDVDEPADWQRLLQWEHRIL
jgi:rSAM/selenodomain-associated transferase 2/rSAM/selenodomain-associated transferase 1